MFIIRRYQNLDFNAIWSLHKRALQQVNADMGLDDNDLKKIEEVYIDSGGEFLVGEFSGRVVGMGALRKVSEDTVELKRMRVDPEYQGRGFGAMLLQALEDRAQESFYRKIVLDTTTRQNVARIFYEKHGYTETGRKLWKGYEIIYYEKYL